MRRTFSCIHLLIAVNLVLGCAVIAAATPVQVSERQKFDAERRERARELAVAERAQGLAERDFELRWAQGNESRWTSPLVLAVLAAAIAAAGNALVALLNGRQQRALEGSRAADSRKLEQAKGSAQRKLDAQKSESDRILEVLKTGGDPDAAARNMQFLIDAGLVTKRDLLRRLTKFLDSRKPGAGPALPSVEGLFSFKRDPGLTPAVEARLTATLATFISYLLSIGFVVDSGPINVEIARDTDQLGIGASNALYSATDKTLFIGINVREDPDVVLRIYMEHVLTISAPGMPTPTPSDLTNYTTYTGIMLALADYYTCSYAGRPELGEISARALGSGTPYFRTLATLHRYSGNESGQSFSPWDEVAIWGPLFWAIRNVLGQEATDKLLRAAWGSIKWTSGRDPAAHSVLDAIWAQLDDKESREAVRGVLERAEFPQPAAA